MSRCLFTRAKPLISFVSEQILTRGGSPLISLEGTTKRSFSTLTMQRIKFIIDSDLGTDDACALILALSHPQAEILALTTIFGNIPLRQAVANASRIRKLVRREDVPIYAGASGPLILSRVEERRGPSPYHGHDGLGDVPECFPPAAESDYQAAVQGKHAVEAIIDIVHKHPGCTLLCLGPLTNLALAMKLDPTVSSNLKHVYLMGGNIQAVGNVDTASTAEFNFWKDPEAAHIVFSEIQCPMTAIPWELYLNNPCSKEFKDAYTKNATTKKGEFVQAILRNPLTLCDGFEFGLCDELATAIAIDPSIALESEKRYYATIELQGLYTRGQVAFDYKHISGRKPNVEYVTKVDLGKAERMLLESLKDTKSGTTPD